MVQPHKTVPGLDAATSEEVQRALHGRLVGLLDLQLTLKHAHWNVVGTDFLTVHEMLDEHVAGVRAMTDAVAERIRTLGGVPIGTPGHIVEHRTWNDYPLGRDTVTEHLAALDAVYTGVIGDHREAIAATGVDPVSEDLLITQTAQLELFQWFIRSFIENAGPEPGRTGAWNINGPAEPAMANGN